MALQSNHQAQAGDALELLRKAGAEIFEPAAQVKTSVLNVDQEIVIEHDIENGIADRGSKRIATECASVATRPHGCGYFFTC